MTNEFEIIPAIDILGGKCVRLTHGQYDKAEEFSSNPEEIAKKWINCGAERIHLVDLDGAKQGQPVNFNIILKIAKLSSGVKIQAGGGIRTKENIKKYLAEGISYVILGTKAFQDKDFFKEASDLYKNKIILGLDLKNGRVGLSGWQETIEINLNNLSEHLGDIHQIIYTDISKDGTLGGPNLKSLETVAGSIRSKIIASGGVSSIQDIIEILKLKKEKCPNITGVILGKSLYKQKVDLREAIELTKKSF